MIDETKQQLAGLRKNLAETKESVEYQRSAFADSVQITIVIAGDIVDVLEKVIADLEEHMAKLEHLPGKD